jgi:hypothetical protein
MNKKQIYRKLIKKIRNNGIKVIFYKFWDVDNSAYDVKNKIIYLGIKNSSIMNKIVTLAHEAAHAKQRSQIYMPYKLTWRDLMLEIGAWKTARKILYDIGMKHWKTFEKERRICISSYFHYYYQQNKINKIGALK